MNQIKLPYAERIGTATRTFLSRPHRLLIDGDWVAAQSGGTFQTFDPGTGLLLATVAEAREEDVDAAVAAARKAFDHGPWSAMKPAERARILMRLADLIEANADELAELETLDNGMPLSFARHIFVPGAVEQFRYFAGWCTKIGGQSIELSLPGDWHAYTVREPVGVVAQIVAWNVPLLMAALKSAPALAAGCTVILKPAEETPLSALRLGELALEAGLPPGVLNILTGDGEHCGAHLSAHPDVDKISFTGSTEVGRLIVKASAGNLKKVSLELGGKSPVIVFPDADIEAAIAGAANAIFFNSGQVCAAGSRLLVHQKVYEQVLEGVANIAKTLKIGHGLEADSLIGPLISAQQLQRVTGYMQAGAHEGAKVLAGGGRLGEAGFFVQPTVLGNTRPDMSVVREEIFGPVVSAMSFDDGDLQRIAREANNTPYGLAASIWTRDISIAHKLARKVRAGTVWLNSHNYLDPALPWGGFKQSGWGREMGLSAIEAYTEVKSIAALL